MLVVVEGYDVPMNLYSEEAYYFLTEEVYSFHMGLMSRISVSNEDYNTESYVEEARLWCDMTLLLLRKLKSISKLIDTATEIKDFQVIGVQCKEIIIELGNYIYYLLWH